MYRWINRNRLLSRLIRIWSSSSIRYSNSSISCSSVVRRWKMDSNRLKSINLSYSRWGWKINSSRMK